MTSTTQVKIEPDDSLLTQFGDGLRDLWRALQHWELWSLIGWLEVSQRYRRSIIGPFWITLSLGFVVLGLGVVYSTLFRLSAAEYIPYLATGLIAWSFISTLVNDSCATFVAAEGSIKMLPVPLSIYVYRMVWRNLIILAHNAVVYLLLILYFRINPGWGALLSLVGIALVSINGVGFGLTLGVLSARFRDIPLMIANGVQLIFFVTPILWRPETLASREWIYQYNPFHYMIEVVRGPLLGEMPSGAAWGVVMIFTAANLAIGLALFGRFRWRIAYWV